jgi:6,7-dimethyl-8-ribityllumazine synthase
MQGADRGREAAAAPDGRGLSIGLVQARFNAGLTDRLAAACRAELLRLGVAEDAIVHVTVPGALEIGIALDAMARRGGFHALVALGCVIRGETYHFELVANESGRAVTRVGLDHRLPIANAVLTVETEAQAEVRCEPKGREAAEAAVEMARLLERLGPGARAA